MLPPRDERFVGRHDLINVLQNEYRNRHKQDPGQTPVRLLVGRQGVGKSATAVRVTYLLCAHPAGIKALYQDLNENLEPSQVLRRFLIHLKGSREQVIRDVDNLRDEYADNPQQFTEELYKKYVEYTAERQTIVVLDNAQNYEQIKYLIPQSNECFVIVTAREDFAQGRITSGPVTPLGESDSLDLIRRLAFARSDITPETARKLAEKCANLPIAIKAIALLLEEHQDYPVTQLLRDFDAVYAETTGETPETRSILTAQELVYRRLDPTEQQVFRRLGLSPGESFDSALAAHLGNLEDARDARRILQSLLKLSLVQATSGDDYFTMHSSWREFAVEQSRRAEEYEGEVSRALTFYLGLLVQANRDLNAATVDLSAKPSPRWNYQLPRQEPRQQALNWLRDEHRNLVAAVRKAIEVGELDMASSFCGELIDYFDAQSEWESWKATHQELLRELLRRGLGQSLAAGQLRRGLGQLYAAVHSWTAAVSEFRQAVSVFSGHVDAELDLAWSYLALADVFRYTRRWHSCENCLDEAERELSTAEGKFDAGERLLILRGRLLRTQSTIPRLKGQFGPAVRKIESARQSFEKAGNERWISAAKLSEADILLDQGQYHRARELLLECLEVFGAIGDKHWEMLTKLSLGIAYLQSGEPRAAITFLKESIRSADATGDTLWAAQAVFSLGRAEMEINQHELSTMHLEQALESFEKAGDSLWEARAHRQLGELARRVHGQDSAEAFEHFRRSLPLLVEQGAEGELKSLKAELRRFLD